MNSPKRALKGMRALGWRDRFEVLHIVFLAVVIEAGLHALSVRTLARLLRVDLDLDSQDVGVPMKRRPPEWAVRRIVLTRAVLRYSGQTCLRNSFVVANRLRVLSPRLRIGVNKDGTGLRAHAWLEIEGEYFDPGATEYKPLHSAGA
jgi:hypothetical protein